MRCSSRLQACRRQQAAGALLHDNIATCPACALSCFSAGCYTQTQKTRNLLDPSRWETDLDTRLQLPFLND